MKPDFDPSAIRHRANQLALRLRATARVDRYGIVVKVPGYADHHVKSWGAVIAHLDSVAQRMYCLTCRTVQLTTLRAADMVRCSVCDRALSPSPLKNR